MQRNVVTTAKRQLLDLTANYTLSSVISGNAATAPPPPRTAAFGPEDVHLRGRHNPQPVLSCPRPPCSEGIMCLFIIRSPLGPRCVFCVSISLAWHGCHPGASIGR